MKTAVSFSRELWIEQDDFAEVPPPKFFRPKPGGEVRLKYAYIIKCDEVIKDPTGQVVELRCTADLDSKTGGATAGRNADKSNETPLSSAAIKGKTESDEMPLSCAAIHWVSAKHAIEAECRLYDRLFTKADPEDVGPVTSPGDSPVGTAGPAVRSGFMANINPHSIEVVTAKCEPSLKDAKPDLRYQFERLAHFALDPDSQPGKLVFNRTITLKDAWAKIESKQKLWGHWGHI